MKDNIALIISIIGISLSLLNFALVLISRHKKIKLSILEYSHGNKTHQFLLGLENCSQLPISISSIFLICDGIKYECTKTPHIVKRDTTYEIGLYNTKEITSIAFPIAISSLGSLRGYVEFPNSPKAFENHDTVLSFSLHTNRGKIKSLKVPLDSKCRHNNV